MNSCVMCGASIPEGQKICSMCYGDVGYGEDGHYRRYLEECERQEQENDLVNRND